MSDIASPYSAMSAEQAEEALSRMTVPEIFATFSSMVEPDFMPRIPVFVKEGYDIILFQTRAPGTIPAKLQISADYKVECMVRFGTHKRINYSKDVYLMLMFFKPKLRVGIAEFDGPNCKASDELHAFRPLVDFRASNQAQYYPVHLIEWSPHNKANIAGIPPGTAHFADHDSKDAYHAMQLEQKGKRMHWDVPSTKTHAEMTFISSLSAANKAKLHPLHGSLPGFGMDTHALLAPITLYGG